MSLTETVRKYIECPQFGDEQYGAWGALNFHQKQIIKMLCDRIDYQDKIIEQLLTKDYKVTNDKHRRLSRKG